MTPRIAFCFLTYSDIHQGALWKSFFSGHENLFNIYVHNKYPIEDKFFSHQIVKNIIDTQYGSITQLKASINLFQAAYDNPENRFFILVSGSCLPLHQFEYIYQKIISLDATLFKMLQPLLGRLKYMKDQSVFNRDNFKTQSTWMVMKREDWPTIRDNDLTDSVFGPRVFGVDHHYFINLFDMFHQTYKEYPVTWDNWAEPDIRKNPHHYGPKTYDTLDGETIQQARDEGSLFIRKVSEHCEIDEKLVKMLSG